MPKLKQRYGVKIKGETFVWRDGAVVSLNGAKLSNPLGDVPNNASIDRHKRQVGQANVSYVNQSENSSKSQQENLHIVLVNEKGETFGLIITQFPQTQNKPNAFLRGAYLWTTPKGSPIDSSQQAFLPKVKRGNFSSSESQETQSKNPAESQEENLHIELVNEKGETFGHIITQFPQIQNKPHAFLQRAYLWTTPNILPIDSPQQARSQEVKQRDIPSSRVHVQQSENSSESQSENSDNLNPSLDKRLDVGNVENAINKADVEAELIADILNENPDVKKEATFGFFFCRIIN